jgi:hypothetical protein
MKLNDFNDVMKKCFGSRLVNIPAEEEKEYCEYCEELIEEEHICYTCCGDEITGDVEDLGLCPTCKEHI